MRRIWRYLWITTTVLIGLLLLLVFIISQINLNQFKKTIEIQITELTGRQLILDGNLHLEISLHPALSIENASFANAPWGKQPHMLSLEKLYVKIDLMPIFDNQLVVEQLLLDGADLSVETNADGQINWQLEKFSSIEQRTVIEKTESKPFQLPFLPLLKQVKFDTVRFYYNDSMSEIQTDIVVESLRLSNPEINKAINFAANGSVNQHPFEFTGETSFLTAVTTQNIMDQGLKIKANADALGITLAVDGKIEDPVAVEGINVAILLEADDLDKTFTIATGKSIYQYLRKSSKPLSLNLSARLKDITGGYALSKIKFNLADNDLNGDLSFFHHPDRPKIIAKLDSRKININQLLPEKSKQKKQSKTNTGTESPGIKLPETALPFDLLKSLDADIYFTIGEVLIDEFNPGTIKLNAALKDGLLKVKQLDLNLDGAPVRSSLTIDSRDKTPRISTRLDINNLQLGIITQQLQLDQIKTGTLQSKINLKTRGKNIKSLLLNLKGEAHIQLHDVSLEQQMKDKTHSVNIKQLNLVYFGINEPLKYNLSGDIDSEPLALSGQLDSPASIINNKTLGLELKLNTVKVDLEIEGSINNPLQADSAKLYISLDIPEPRTSIIQISHLVPKVQLDEKIPKLPVTLQGLLTVSPDTYRFEKLQVKAGDSDLSGNIFADLRREKPFIDAKLESQLLDLNALVPATRRKVIEEPHKTEPPLDDEEEIDKTDTTKIFSTKPLPVFDALDNIDINLIYNLKKLTANNQSIDNIYLNMVLKDGLLRLDPLSIDFAKGTIKSKLELSAIQKIRFRLDTKIIKLDYDRLMAILGTKEYARGELDAEINLTGEGNSISTLMASLNGTVRVTTIDGVLHSDSLKLLSKDLVSIIPFTDTSNRQKINCGVIQFDINKGIASTHAMVINTGAISALGTGDIDLANETLSLYIAPRSRRTSMIKLALVPVNVTGPLSSPSVSPDLAGSTISTTKTATNIGLTIATGGIWLLAEGVTNDLWDKFVDNTDYCAKALAGEKIVPARIKLESTKVDTENDTQDGFGTYGVGDDDDW
jgi:uncharacterized protein involved in outer membrane biogenesis